MRLRAMCWCARCAVRGRAGGRPSQAIIGYTAISRNLELLAKYAHLQRKGEGLPAPVFNIIFAEGAVPQIEDVPGSPLELKLSHLTRSAPSSRRRRTVNGPRSWRGGGSSAKTSCRTDLFGRTMTRC